MQNARNAQVFCTAEKSPGDRPPRVHLLAIIISNIPSDRDRRDSKEDRNGTAALFRPSAPFFSLSLSLSLSLARSSMLDEVKVPTLKLAETRRRIRR